MEECMQMWHKLDCDVTTDLTSPHVTTQSIAGRRDNEMFRKLRAGGRKFNQLCAAQLVARLAFYINKFSVTHNRALCSRRQMWKIEKARLSEATSWNWWLSWNFGPPKNFRRTIRGLCFCFNLAGWCIGVGALLSRRRISPCGLRRPCLDVCVICVCRKKMMKYTAQNYKHVEITNSKNKAASNASPPFLQRNFSLKPKQQQN